jgi:hypothetical protein
MVAATLAICRGETRTSRWPIADWAVAGTSWVSGMELVAAGSSYGLGSLNPNFSASAASFSSPSSTPSAAKVVLQEIRSASGRVRLPSPQLLPPKLRISAEVWGTSNTGGDGSSRLVETPFSSAAAAVTTLKVDPGGYSAPAARLSSGPSGSSTSRFQFRRMPSGSWLDRSLGS